MNIRRKIVIISSSYPFGLKETFLHNEVVYLSKYFDIEIYPVIKSSPNAVAIPTPANVSFHNPIVQNNYLKRVFFGIFNTSPIIFYLNDLKLLIRSGKPLKKKFIEWLLSLLVFRTIFSSRAFKNLRSTDAELIYFYWGGQPIQLYRKLNKKIFVRVHGGEVDIKRQDGYIPVIRYKVNDLTNIHYLPISENAASLLNAIRPVHSTINRLGVFDYGMNPSPGQGDIIRIVSCSNMIPLKRINLIIEALSDIYIAMEWVHFGDGPLFDYISQLSKKLPRAINVRLMGRVKNDVIMDFYRSTPIDLFINVSQFEGVPVSIMEAFSVGIPCFATDVGGTREIVNESNGYLAEPNFHISELSSFIRNIRSLVSTKNLRENARLTWQTKCNAVVNYQELTDIFNRNN